MVESLFFCWGLVAGLGRSGTGRCGHPQPQLLRQAVSRPASGGVSNVTHYTDGRRLVDTDSNSAHVGRHVELDARFELES